MSAFQLSHHFVHLTCHLQISATSTVTALDLKEMPTEFSKFYSLRVSTVFWHGQSTFSVFVCLFASEEIGPGNNIINKEESCGYDLSLSTVYSELLTAP